MARMGSSLQVGQILIGRTGVSYCLQKVLYERIEQGTKNKDIMRRLWLAQSKNNSYIVKPVTTFKYSQGFRLQRDLPFSPFVRLPVNGNDANMALIFQYYNKDFLSFMQSGPVSRPQVKRILLDILKGVAACHSKGWVHYNVKPNNVLILYTSRPDGIQEINGVSLSDTEDAARVNNGEAIFF